MRDWKLYGDSYECTTYKSFSSDTNDVISFTIDKSLKTISFTIMYFILNDSATWEAQQAEENEFLKHSCEYGHWQADTILTLSAEDMQFALDKYREVIQNDD